MNYCLKGVDPSNPTMGGYEYLEWTGTVFHPGVDLNVGWGDADLGLPVSAPVRLEIVAVVKEPTGFGNHVWGRNGQDYLHFCHLDSILVHEGETIEPGVILGLCGKSGGWTWAHLHLEVLRRKPWSWGQWVSGWSAESVVDYYYDPIQWLKDKTEVDADDQAIIDAVRSLGGGPSSPGDWVSALNAYKERSELLAEEVDSLKRDKEHFTNENDRLQNQVNALGERLSHVDEAVGQIVLVFKDGTRREVNV